MRKMAILILIMLVPSLATAQSAERRGQGYLFFAPGGATGGGRTSATWHFGGGGEGMIYKGLAVGGEIGYLAPTGDFRSGFGLLSANGSYHFGRGETARKVSPFLTAGYSRLFAGGGGANAVNFGGGFNYWMRERIGLRIEFRDHVTTGGRSTHFWQGRFALAFR